MSRFRRRYRHRARGRIGYLGRRGWRWRHRRRRYNTYRRFRPRLRHRRSFSKRIRRKFFRPNPGTEIQRISRPYNTLNVYFQGIIFVSTTKAPNANSNITYTRATKIDISFANFLRAVLPRDYVSKLGGPCWGALHNTHNTSQTGATQPNEWPNADPIKTQRTPSSNPTEWWRWALLFMYPADNVRFLEYPKVIEPEEMIAMFSQYQLFRHIKTTFKVECTDDGGQQWSPIASLLLQDLYWEIGPKNDQYTASIIQPSTMSVYKTGDTWTPNATVAPGRQYWDSYKPSGPAKASFSGVQCWQSEFKFPSFAELSALGAPWAFPPNQKPVTFGSFNKHKMIGRNDPLAGPWLQMMPKNLFVLDTDAVTKGDLYTVLGTLFLAQGTNTFDTYKYGTLHTAPDNQNTALQQKNWAIIKVQSHWRLANTRRPYKWDVAWVNTTGTYP